MQRARPRPPPLGLSGKRGGSPGPTPPSSSSATAATGGGAARGGGSAPLRWAPAGPSGRSAGLGGGGGGGAAAVPPRARPPRAGAGAGGARSRSRSAFRVNLAGLSATRGCWGTSARATTARRGPCGPGAARPRGRAAPSPRLLRPAAAHGGQGPLAGGETGLPISLPPLPQNRGTPFCAWLRLPLRVAALGFTHWCVQDPVSLSESCSGQFGVLRQLHAARDLLNLRCQQYLTGCTFFVRPFCLPPSGAGCSTAPAQGFLRSRR